MCRADLNKVVSYLDKHLDEPKLLSEWNMEFNNKLTKRERLTMRELACAFKIIKAREILIVEQNSNYYQFSTA